MVMVTGVVIPVVLAVAVAIIVMQDAGFLPH
jgi:hypothetical protein